MPALSAQTAPSQPAAVSDTHLPFFDVASIKPNKTGSDHTSNLTTDEGTYTASNVNIPRLIQIATGIREHLIYGLPPWAEGARFDINAKVVDPDLKVIAALTREQHQTIMQALLADRFQLKWHMETRILPVYELVVARGGIKFKESPGNVNGGSSGISVSQNEHSAEVKMTNSPIANFTSMLSDNFHRGIVDKTGLTAKYDFTLKWTPENAPHTDSNEDAPSIFTALQEQLGLRLQPAKGLVQILVVDHVEKPSEN